MVVLDSGSGSIDVPIRCDQAILEPYCLKVDDPLPNGDRRKCCYIASKADKVRAPQLDQILFLLVGAVLTIVHLQQFEVVVKSLTCFAVDSNLEVYLDGVCVSAMLLRKGWEAGKYEVIHSALEENNVERP